MKKRPRINSIVKWSPRVPGMKDERLKVGRSYLFLCEIKNMPGHCAVIDMLSGKVIAGYHSDTFTELEADEL